LTANTPGQHAMDPGVLPSSINAPGWIAHGTHAALDGAALTALAVPEGHGVHAVAPDRL
jgi:hypothetical protein